ncbi:ATP-binding protein [Streptomyces sp. SLBN-31]|uniref:ATP-binding protein n=1 Tax=Streptomyces sp. SLBN-31 TaxID=2768444 RepID=UPI00114D7581|nr:ATP-binding protein [Streptomyces sp. SLBN-31]TQJ74777.1 signal transduction histidine kinase [Streptomyces sp. SLBN-31]
MTAPLQPGERASLRSLAPVPLLTAVLAALAVAGAVARTPQAQRVPVALGAGAGALLLCVAVAVATHSVRTARITRRRLEAVTADTGRLLQDRIRQSAEFDQERVRLTEELTRERARYAAELAQERARSAAAIGAERARTAAEHAELTERARRAEQERAAAISATANAAGRMQALATGMLADLRAMEERHEDEDVLADLLHLDHRTAQAGRIADSVAVLAGARSGRRWARPIGMESILRGAMGRISGYRRVRVHSACEAAVAGHAAEGVMHALAELLDNAANFSPPTAEVHVYVEEVPAGVILSVEDSGLVMGDVQLRRAERAVSGDLGGLGGLTGTRLGLAVVGRLALKYGLKVSYRPSARGGTGVLMLVPQDILVPEQPAAPAPVPLALPETPPEPATEPPTGRPVEGAEWGAGERTGTGDTGTPNWPWFEGGSLGEGSWPGGVGATLVPYGEEWPVSYGHSTSLVPAETHHQPASSEQSPLPGHEASDRGAGPLPEGLPQRRRGRALAEVEKERVRARADDEPPRPAVVSLDDPLARAARFSSFQRAVRGSLSDLGSAPAWDTAAPADPASAPDPTSTSRPHPEGNATS